MDFRVCVHNVFVTQFETTTDPSDQAFKDIYNSAGGTLSRFDATEALQNRQEQSEYDFQSFSIGICTVMYSAIDLHSAHHRFISEVQDAPDSIDINTQSLLLVGQAARNIFLEVEASLANGTDALTFIDRIAQYMAGLKHAIDASNGPFHEDGRRMCEFWAGEMKGCIKRLSRVAGGDENYCFWRQCILVDWRLAGDKVSMNTAKVLESSINEISITARIPPLKTASDSLVLSYVCKGPCFIGGASVINCCACQPWPNSRQ